MTNEQQTDRQLVVEQIKVAKGLLENLVDDLAGLQIHFESNASNLPRRAINDIVLAARKNSNQARDKVDLVWTSVMMGLERDASG